MSDTHSSEEIDRHVRTYILVFVSLMVLTVVTVAVYYLPLGLGASIAIALAIASIKASLVACFFMHLISEKKLIFAVMALTVAFFLVLLFVPLLTSIADQVAS